MATLGRKRSIQAHRQPQLEFHYLRHADRNFSVYSSHLTRRRAEKCKKRYVITTRFFTYGVNRHVLSGDTEREKRVKLVKTA